MQHSQEDHHSSDSSVHTFFEPVLQSDGLCGVRVLVWETTTFLETVQD